MKSLVENRGRWDAGFRSPLLRFSGASIALLLKIAEPSDSDLTGPKCREGYASKLKMSTAPQQNESDRLAEILPRGLLHRSRQESPYTEFVQRSLQEILPTDLLIGSLYTDLFKRSCQETLFGDLVHRTGAGNRYLAQRSL